MLPFAVTVTVPVLVVSPAAMVRVVALDRPKSPATAGPTAAAVTVTVVASLDGPDSVAVTVDTPPVSEIDAGASTRATPGASSSSVMVRVTSGGFVAPWLLAAVPDTLTCLFGASVGLSTAVTVTVPALVVTPAAMVRVLALDRLKSPATAPVVATSAAATVTVVASLDGRSSVAVTVDTPPSSAIDVADKASATVGAASSSVMVRVASGGFATLLPPAAVPETVTVLFGASVVLSTAVTVTVPVLVTSPAAMVRVVALDRLKSPATAPDAATSAADTVTVTASLDAPDSVAVTVDTPPFSDTDAGFSDSVTVGAASSSVMVRVTSGGSATLLPPVAVPETVTDLSGESTSLPLAVTVTVPVLVTSPAAMIKVVALDRSKSAATAPVPADAETVTVTAALDAPDSVAVTVDTPPVSEIEVGDSTSATVGSVSPWSVRVSVAPVTAPVPWPLASVAVTVPERPALPWWTVSFTAVTVAVSVAAVVSPAGIVMVASPTV